MLTAIQVQVVGTGAWGAGWSLCGYSDWGRALLGVKGQAALPLLW